MNVFFKKAIMGFISATFSLFILTQCNPPSGNSTAKTKSLADVVFDSALLAPTHKQNFIGKKQHYYGASYYPEAWSMDEVDKDIALMKELKMNCVRMGEFAWSTYEPEEGKYNFEWLKKILDKLHAANIDVILGTPTATPPAWLCQKYPEIMRTDYTGLQKIHGERKDYCKTSIRYRLETQRIVEKMAQELGNHPAVIGWQTDNELHADADYSEHTVNRFRQWLKNKYGTIEEMNRRYNGALWSLGYSNFEQIPMPRPDIWHHPSLVFDMKKFNSDMVVEYQNIHIQAIRKYSKAPIMHDAMSPSGLDYFDLFKNLDFPAFNNYHSFEAYDRLMSNYDRNRGMGKGMYWLTETAPNYSGGGNNGQTWFIHQPVDALFSYIWMNHQMGGQGTLFWLWRQHSAAQEMVHGSVLSAWGKKAANWNQLKTLGESLEKTSPFLMDAQVPKAKIAFMFSHRSLHGLSYEQYSNGIDAYKDWTYRFYLPVHNAYLEREVISTEHSLDSLKVLFVPLTPFVPEETRTRIAQWVENGGTLIWGPMTGYRTQDWTSFTNYAMGDFEKWAGIEVDSRIPIGVSVREAEEKYMLDFDPSFQLPETQAFVWSEALSTQSGKVLATYKNGMHAGKPAIIENKVGKGKVIVLGTDPGKAFIAKLALVEGKAYGIEPLATGDAGVVITRRMGVSGNGLVINNTSTQPKAIKLTHPVGGTDLLSGKAVAGTDFKLKPFEVLVIKNN